MEFFWDTLQCNWDYFRDIDLTLPQISELIFKIFDWCYTDKVYFDNDCNDHNTEWRNWKETGSVIDIIEDMLKNKVSKPSNINKEEAAKILFDGDEVKAKILLELLESCSVHIGTFDELKMVLPTE